MALGDVYRRRQQIERLASTLLGAHRTDTRAIRRIVSTLAKELGSHDYLISRTEARQILGAQVAADSPDLEGLMWELYRDFAAEMHLGVPYDSTQALRSAQDAGHPLGTPLRLANRIVVIESTLRSNVFERERELSQQVAPGTPPAPGAAVRLVAAGPLEDAIVGHSWKTYT